MLRKVDFKSNSIPQNQLVIIYYEIALFLVDVRLPTISTVCCLSKTTKDITMI